MSTRRRFSNRARDGADWFKITNQLNNDPTVTEVFIMDEIGYWGTTASDFIAQLSDISTTNIDLHVSSPGGEVFDGVAIYECLRAHPANVTVYVDALAASIASVISMAGDEIVMGRAAQMMIHDASGMCWGNSQDMRDTATLLDRLSDTIAGIYAERTGTPVAQWREAMQAETWFFAQEAVDAGLADRLADAKKKPCGEGDPVEAKWDLSVFRHTDRVTAGAPSRALTQRDTFNATYDPEFIRQAFRRGA